MVKVTADEVKKIAAMTKVEINDDELDSIVAQFNDVLSYAERVVQVASKATIPSVKNVNSTRPDIVVVTPSELLLQQAPSHEDNYFVVPKFVEN